MTLRVTHAGEAKGLGGPEPKRKRVGTRRMTVGVGGRETK